MIYDGRIAMVCPGCGEIQAAKVTLDDDVPSNSLEYEASFQYRFEFPCGMGHSGEIKYRTGGQGVPSIGLRIKIAYSQFIDDFQHANFCDLPQHVIDPAEWGGPFAIHNN